MRPALQLGCVLLCTACPKPDTDTSVDTDSGTDLEGYEVGPAIAGNIPIGEGNLGPIDCPESGYVLGTAGQFSRDFATFEWTWDSVNQLSYSPSFFAEVAPDTVSLSLTLDADEEEAAFEWLRIGSELWLDQSWGEPPLYHYAAQASSLVFPVNDATYPDAGCFAAQALVPDVDLSGQQSTLYVHTRRYDSGRETLDINVIVLDGTELYQEEVDAAFAAADALYRAGGGPALGTIDVFTATHPSGSILDLEGDDLSLARSILTGESSQRMNVVFVSDFVDSGVLGIAAGIPGALGIEGTAGSAVIVAVDGHLSGNSLDTQYMGETIAHEIGHQMGLFHTTEAEGDHDPIADTPACPMSQDDGDGTLTAEECLSFDGANFMFWTGGNVRQTEMSSTQSDVLYFSPIVR